jgi:dTDP-4-amino-4,6-dideoxygalactose transaminase
VVALPMFPEMTEQQQRRVVQTCAGFLRKSHRAAA